MPQFLMRASDLENIYDCIKGVGDSSSALILLSQPEENEWPRERVYSDVLILTLADPQLEELIECIADEEGPSSLIVLLAKSVKKGLATRPENSESDDDDDDEDNWGPGDFGHPLNADGSTRDAFTGDGYCVACKCAQKFSGFVTYAESGRRMAQGACPTCNTKITRILGEN